MRVLQNRNVQFLGVIGSPETPFLQTSVKLVLYCYFCDIRAGAEEVGQARKWVQREIVSIPETF